MNCPACQHANPDGARFCNDCGHRFAVAAPPAAGRQRSPSDYTPKHLADKILTSRSALERRRGDEPAALRHLHAAQQRYAEMGAHGHAQRLARELES